MSSRNTRGKGLLVAGALAAATAGLVGARRPASQPAAAPATQPAATEVAWLGDVNEACKQAWAKRRPVLVVVGAEWCAPCRALEKEMAQEPARGALLKNWICVHLDIDKSQGAGAMLGPAGALPTLRILAPTGRSVAAREGVISAAELARWLGESEAAAMVGFGPELLGADEPDGAAVKKLLEYFDVPDAALREAAIQRLAPHRKAAAVAVAKTLGSGNLATRLGCVELLSQWKAPVALLDPWRPETLTPERLKALESWAEKPAAGPAVQPVEPGDMAEAKREMARMLAAATEVEARVSRERLARVGRELLPEVLAQLKASGSDQARERLTALRYRLVASRTLVLDWPGGLEQLAATDAEQRHKAAAELARRAQAADAPLLLELFGDPDPLVRELSLRALQQASGGAASAALIGLLDDPDANVRAAVLKQFAETPPDDAVLKKVMEFAVREKDSDLVVHAVRVLRSAKGPAAVRTLMQLLSHSSWQVRAETVEALGESANRSFGSDRDNRVEMELRSEALAAMIKLLDDKDGFVVGRVVAALQQADLVAAVDPLAKAAESHPELAEEIVKALTQGDAMKKAALKHLRRFTTHASTAVRGAAVMGIASIENTDASAEIAAGLADPDWYVRAQSGWAMHMLLERLRPRDGVRQKVVSSWLGFSQRVVEERVDGEQWLADFRAGKGRPAWMTGTVPSLQKMLKGEKSNERVAGALGLVALGLDDEALPVLEKDARAESSVCYALPWLPVEKRIGFFNQLAKVLGPEQRRYLAENMAKAPDGRAADPLWGLLTETADAELAKHVYSALQSVYFGQRYFDESRVSAETRARVTGDAKAKLASGTPMQRLAALALLASSDKSEAAAQAQAIYQDASAGELRKDALAVLLSTQPPAQAAKIAVEALGSQDDWARRSALTYLATGVDRLRSLRGGIYLSTDYSQTIYAGERTVISVEAPAGLKAEMVRPMLKGGSAEEAAMAGYLLALLGEKEGMQLLIDRWRKGENRYEGWDKLVYRAVTALKDDSLTGVLEEVYNSYGKDRFEVREFYWTIRSLSGERALKLRKRIRDEVGMDGLR